MQHARLYLTGRFSKEAACTQSAIRLTGTAVSSSSATPELPPMPSTRVTPSMTQGSTKSLSARYAATWVGGGGAVRKRRV